MSRIGKWPVFFDGKTQVTVNSDLNEVIVKGEKASLSVKMRPEIKAVVEENKVIFTRINDEPKVRSLHGLYRSLVQNAVIGVSKGFVKTLELNGVGYRATVAGKKLELTLGYSHPIVFDIPEGIDMKVDKQTVLHITGADKEVVGEIAAKIRKYRPPEPFLGKGIRYSGEHIRRKAGKSAGK